MAYVVDGAGTPWRVGFAAGNEFADHVMEKQELSVPGPLEAAAVRDRPRAFAGRRIFSQLTGDGHDLPRRRVVWSHAIRIGEAHMAHTLANLEHHHFKYAAHRVPGQAHVHFLGAAAFSFGAGVKLADGDVMEVAWPKLGRPLRNPLQHRREAASGADRGRCPS